MWTLVDAGGGCVMGLLDNGVVRTWCVDDDVARQWIEERLRRPTVSPDGAVPR